MQSDIFSYLDSGASPAGEGGPLAGRALTIQPNMSVKGWSAEAGSKALENYIAVIDSTFVERLRAAGAVIKGSTRMSELGFGLSGDTSALAVSAGEVDTALMTDTMGEARIAASGTGAFGFKPSYGIVSRFGLTGLIPSMECAGVVAGNIGDISAVMKVISGHDDRDLSMPETEIPDFSRVSGSRGSPRSVGVINECMESLTEDESGAFRSALEIIEKAGVKIQEISLKDYRILRAVHNIIGSVEASSSGGRYDSVRYGHRAASENNWNDMYLKSRSESFGLLVKTYMLQGAYFQFENYDDFKNACRIRARILRKTEEIFKNTDFIVSPTRHPGLSIDSADTVSGVYDIFDMTLLANLCGWPSITIPGLAVTSGSDIGLQICGQRLSDISLLSLAAYLAHS